MAHQFHEHVVSFLVALEETLSMGTCMVTYHQRIQMAFDCDLISETLQKPRSKAPGVLTSYEKHGIGIIITTLDTRNEKRMHGCR